MIQDNPYMHNECPYYITVGHFAGFRYITPKKGDHYSGKEYSFNTLIFLLDGEIEISYNQYIGKRFKKGDLIFIPQSSYIYSVAITDAAMLVHTYDLMTDSYCSNCAISKTKFNVDGLTEVKYDFKPLVMTKEIIQFAELISTYISSDFRCLVLHELKQKELFILMHYCYTHMQIIEFFHPILGEDIKFRIRVLRMAHEQLTVEEYAQRFNMGTRSFARKFKAEFGQTVYQWMLQHKMSQIKLKLLLPETSVNDIVEEFKFADTYHFYRFCREHFGCTSKELKLQLRKEFALSDILS